MKVLVNSRMHADDRAVVEHSWPPECDVLVRGDLTADQIEAVAPELVAVIGSIDTPLLRTATRLRLIHVLGHGVDWLNDPERSAIVGERGIAIARANPAGVPIAEYVLGCMIALTRRLIPVHQALALHGDWSGESRANRGRGAFGGELHGSTVVIAGLGSIGREVAARTLAMGMRTVGLTRNPAAYPALASGLSGLEPLAEADIWLAECDYVVLCLPLTVQTRTFMDADRFAVMKPGGYVINVGRGGLLDYEALAGALADGTLAGAAMDVWPDESAKVYPSPRPIHQYNVIMTPHCSALTVEARVRSLRAVGDNLRRWLAGDPLLHRVTI